MPKLSWRLVWIIMAKNKAPKKRIAITLVAILAAVALVVTLFAAVPQLRLKLTPSGEVCDGLLPGVEADVHITEVPQGELRYRINKRIIFENRYAQGSVMLENPESCEYDIKFVICKDDGEMIYTSPLIAPGQYLEKDKLSAAVAPGEYNCSYSAQAYLNGELQGEVTGIVTVVVR